MQINHRLIASPYDLHLPLNLHDDESHNVIKIIYDESKMTEQSFDIKCHEKLANIIILTILHSSSSMLKYENSSPDSTQGYLICNNCANDTFCLQHSQTPSTIGRSDQHFLSSRVWSFLKFYKIGTQSLSNDKIKN